MSELCRWLHEQLEKLPSIKYPFKLEILPENDDLKDPPGRKTPQNVKHYEKRWTQLKQKGKL
ncbi:MAG: hypothetical protein QXU95_06250 [Candidatus Bathyarchaeia archaeon]